MWIEFGFFRSRFRDTVRDATDDEYAHSSSHACAYMPKTKERVTLSRKLSWSCMLNRCSFHMTQDITSCSRVSRAQNAVQWNSCDRVVIPETGCGHPYLLLQASATSVCSLYSCVLFGGSLLWLMLLAVLVLHPIALVFAVNGLVLWIVVTRYW